jgi:hypothetical protein
MDRLARRAGLLACALTVAGVAQAADTFYRPEIDLRAESNDNFDLAPDPDSDSDVYGYVADAQVLIGIATPRSETTIRPRIRYQEYPDREDFSKFEGFFDFRNMYRTERSQLLTIARYSQQDSYNAELPGGEFDPDDPGNPQNPDSGTFVIGETRTRYGIEPEWSFRFTERNRVGVGAEYQAVRFDSDDFQDQTDFDFVGGNAFFGWTTGPRGELIAGAYANKYESTDDTTETKGYGGRIAYEHQWSETDTLAVEMFYETNDTTEFGLVVVEETTSGLGGEITAHRVGEVSDWQFSIGRQFLPTGARGKSESDQIRLQYNRDLSQRLSFTGAGRYETRSALNTAGQGDDRDYARADLSLRWMLSPTWYLQGGYSYIWQEREADGDDASNNRFFVGFGYQGLERQRR